MSNTFLFSIDLEEPKLIINGRPSVLHRLPYLINPLLNFLKQHDIRCTFFIVGELIPLYSEMIKKIKDEGHELAYHSYNHTPLDQLSPQQFADDLDQGLKAFQKIGINNIKGYRAPTLSLTQKTEWAYPVLHKMGFTYSSSVLPAYSPLYGWPEFGPKIKIVNSIWEIPVSLGTGAFKLPFASGTYFRVLPLFITRQLFRSFHKKEIDIVGYFHPYDFDHLQPRYMHEGVNNNMFFHFLIYYNRNNLYSKLNNIYKCINCNIVNYCDYLKQRMSESEYQNRS